MEYCYIGSFIHHNGGAGGTEGAASRRTAKYRSRMTWAVGAAAAVYKPFRAQPVGVYRKINGVVMVGDGRGGSRDHAEGGRRRLRRGGAVPLMLEC